MSRPCVSVGGRAEQADDGHNAHVCHGAPESLINLADLLLELVSVLLRT